MNRMNIFLTDKEEFFLRKIIGLYEKDADETVKLNLETVENLLEAIHKINPKILEHSFRVAVKCVQIATELKFNSDKIKTIALGSLLHDIGVIGTKSDLFRRERKWDKDEFTEYYKHTNLGKEIIEPISSSFLGKTIPFIEKHHEYLNGSGYPNALREQNIPFEVRILTVVNDFDMMSELFPWGEKYPFDKCIETIKKNSSILYDAKVVEQLLKLVGR